MLAIPFSQVRAQFADTLRYVQRQQQAVMISQHGKPTAVLMSIEQFEQQQPSESQLMARLWAWRAAEQVDTSTDDVSEAFEGLRDTDDGRAFEW